ncbi:hypothetical protein BDW22DRAFT_583789 [Trametopsis cervina]|nr:hypothetical protein BDW22DRAFT_583789 [Trametopsis cervina]
MTSTGRAPHCAGSQYDREMNIAATRSKSLMSESWPEVFFTRSTPRVLTGPEASKYHSVISSSRKRTPRLWRRVPLVDARTSSAYPRSWISCSITFVASLLVEPVDVDGSSPRLVAATATCLPFAFFLDLLDDELEFLERFEPTEAVSTVSSSASSTSSVSSAPRAFTSTGCSSTSYTAIQQLPFPRSFQRCGMSAIELELNTQECRRPVHSIFPLPVNGLRGPSR